MGWLKTTPILSLLLAVGFAVAPFAIDPARQWGERYERAIEQAREILVRNPRLTLDAEGERVLDPDWVAELRAAAEETRAGAEVDLPERMVARSQGQLDGLLTQAYEARRLAEPAWRLGVLDGETPARNYWAHAFVRQNLAGLILMLAVLLVAATPLERSWGSVLFGAFALLSIPVSAQIYRLLDASSGAPWYGTSGLAAALVGAYFIRGLGGQFIVPSLVVLPVWLAIEAFVVRGFWLDDLAAVPWATLCGSVGFGAALAALLRLLNIESKLDAHAERRRTHGPNPVVARAARLRSDGDPNQAFELIQAAWRENRQDEEIAEVFYSIATELGQPEAAAEAILPVLRMALKKGQLDRALGYWLPLATRRCEVRLEPTAAVRLGEALLDKGHPDEAIFSLRSAIDAGASTAHAVRILNVARDLDPGLTRRAAAIALADPSLDAPTRAKLLPLADLPDDEGPRAPANPVRPERSRTLGATRLERSVEPEHHAVEGAGLPSDPHEAQLEGQSLFGGALSEESFAEGPSSPSPTQDLSGAAPSDVLSHWNDRGALSEDALDGPLLDTSAGDAVEELLGSTSLGSDGDLFGDQDIDFLDLDGDITDSDQTPLLDASDATDELTSPMADANRPSADPGSDPDHEATVMMTAGPAAARAAKVLLRSLRAIDAVPVEASTDGVEIDTDGRGKSRLPFARIEAVAIAVVRGLGPRPVLVVDCILNWRDDIASPLKLIRFRSDRFPVGLDAAAVGVAGEGTTPIAALGSWAAAMQRAAGAACLPSEAILAGSYASFAALEDYEREVLGAEREPSA